MARSRNHCRIRSCVAWLLLNRVSYTKRAFSVLVGKLAAPLRSAWSANSMKNSACCPLAVCSITHGAILVAADGGLETAAPCWLPTAREEAMAPMAAAVAATKNNKQKIRRHLDAVNVGVGFEFLIIEVAGAFGLFDWFVERKPNPACRTNRRPVSNLFWKILHFEARTGWLLNPREEVSSINFALPARRGRELRPRESVRSWECDAFRIAFSRIGAGSQSICVVLRCLR